MYLGFDRLQYPGDDVMQSLWETTPLAFVAAYLAPAPSQRYTGWMAHVQDLKAAGWGLLPTYVGQQAPGGPGSQVLTKAQGRRDAADAVKLAERCGLDAGSVVYLDVEQGGILAGNLLSYIEAWVADVRASDYAPGVYCSAARTAAQVVARVGDLPVWVFRLRDAGPSTVDLAAEVRRDPADSGYPDALAWQYRQSLNGPVDLTWVDATGAPRSLRSVDVDVALCPDPSHPVLPTPSLTALAQESGTAGDRITITGFDLLGVTDLAFGAVNAADLRIDADHQITVTVPEGLSGEVVDLVAINRWNNQSQEALRFSVDPSFVEPAGPTVTQVFPASGARGESITVLGSGFDDAIDVAFGPLSAAGMDVGSDSELLAVVPDGLEGEVVGVTVTDRWGRTSGDTVAFAVDAA